MATWRAHVTRTQLQSTSRLIDHELEHNNMRAHKLDSRSRRGPPLILSCHDPPDTCPVACTFAYVFSYVHCELMRSRALDAKLRMRINTLMQRVRSACPIN